MQKFLKRKRNIDLVKIDMSEKSYEIIILNILTDCKRSILEMIRSCQIIF